MIDASTPSVQYSCAALRSRPHHLSTHTQYAFLLDERVEIHGTTRTDMNGRRGVATDFHIIGGQDGDRVIWRYTVKLMAAGPRSRSSRRTCGRRARESPPGRKWRSTPNSLCMGAGQGMIGTRRQAARRERWGRRGCRPRVLSARCATGENPWANAASQSGYAMRHRRLKQGSTTTLGCTSPS